MKKDKLDELFENLKDGFDVYETPEGHKKRFLRKLEKHKTSSGTYRKWWKPLSIAASVVIIVALGFMYVERDIPTADLASVSPEMAQTQSFFTAAFNKEMNTLKGFHSPETKVLVEDALKQMDILETEYESLKKDLVSSGNDKRVVYAMINNFQKRIDLLKQVIAKIEMIKKLNTETNETTI